MKKLILAICMMTSIFVLVGCGEEPEIKDDSFVKPITVNPITIE